MPALIALVALLTGMTEAIAVAGAAAEPPGMVNRYRPTAKLVIENAGLLPLEASATAVVPVASNPNLPDTTVVFVLGMKTKEVGSCSSDGPLPKLSFTYTSQVPSGLNQSHW